MQRVATYFAVFEPGEACYGVYFPDLPAWLKNAAEAAGLNYSQVLQAALIERLGASAYMQADK